MSELEKIILDALEAHAAEHDADIVDVEVTGANKSTVVTVRVDYADERDTPISLDEVAEHGAWINEVLDEIDPIANSYTLEVSSPGMARPLRKVRDFERFSGETVKLESTATVGRRKYTGILLGIKDQIVCIDCDGEQFEIPLAQVKRCVIKPNYDFSTKNE